MPMSSLLIGYQRVYAAKLPFPPCLLYRIHDMPIVAVTKSEQYPFQHRSVDCSLGQNYDFKLDWKKKVVQMIEFEQLQSSEMLSATAV